MEERSEHSNTLFTEAFLYVHNTGPSLTEEQYSTWGHRPYGVSPDFPLDVSPDIFYMQLRDSGLPGFLGAIIRQFWGMYS